jgi:CPA1 family monovalent cation:H+ antiporter
MRIEALRAERDQLYQLRLNRQLDDVLHRQLVHEIDLIETALTKRNKNSTNVMHRYDFLF